MVPGGNRNKGHDAEREVVRILGAVIEEILGEPTLHRNLNQTRQGGHDIAGLEFLALEVKRCETLEIEKWWQQTLRQAEQAGGAIPVLMYRQNRKPWTYLMIGQIGRVVCRVAVEQDAFLEWLKDEVERRVRGGEILARSGFYDNERGRQGEGEVGGCIENV